MPAQPLGWFKEQIKDSSQLEGLKYRTVGLAADVLLEMGMSVVQLPGGEIQPAMKSSLIDAAEFNNPTSDRDFGMQDVSKHYHLASFHQSQEFFEVTFNKDKYDGLSDELKAILKYASEAENSNFYWHNTRRYADDLVKLSTEQGVNVYRTPDSVMSDQLKAWDIVIDRLSAKDEFFAEVIASRKAYAKTVMHYLNLNQPDYKLAYDHHSDLLAVDYFIYPPYRTDHAGVATGVVRNPDYFCAHFPADAGYLWRQPLFLRHAGSAEFTNIIPDSTDGDVRLLLVWIDLPYADRYSTATVEGCEEVIEILGDRIERIPAALGEAPVFEDGVGDPVCCTIWTLCGLPCLSLPLLVGENQLPVGIQLVARENEDDRMFRTTRWLLDYLKPG